MNSIEEDSMRTTLVRYYDRRFPQEVNFSLRVDGIQWHLAKGTTLDGASKGDRDRRRLINDLLKPTTEPLRWNPCPVDSDLMAVEEATVDVSSNELRELGIGAPYRSRRH